MATSVVAQIALEVWGAVFCILCAAIVLSGRKTDPTGARLQFGLLGIQTVQLVSDTLAYWFRGKVGATAFYMVRCSNLLVFLCNYMLAAVFVCYIAHVIRGRGHRVSPKWKYITYSLSLLGTMNLLLSQVTRHLYSFDAQNTYSRGNWFWSIIVLSGTELLLLMLMLLVHRKRMKTIHFYTLLVYGILVFGAILAQPFLYGISLTNLAGTVSVLLNFAVYQIGRSARYWEQEKISANQLLDLAQKQQELTNTRMALMLSQIQPHFISNSLLTIQGLYHEDMDKADYIMNSFIHFLQQNFSRLSETEPIAMADELDYTRNFTAIACERWPDMEVEYIVDCDCFRIPAMTLQPIVENAIRHGLMPLESGGKVTIHAFETKSDYCVRVQDNGVGFDINNPKPQYRDNRIHIGLSNIRTRLHAMCGGTLQTESVPGHGTTVTIHIPKNRSLL